MYRIKLDDNDSVLTCYTGGKLKQHKIKIILGDRVKIEVSMYDLTKGRVTYRL
jgi:translation initiation factor IF-1